MSVRLVIAPCFGLYLERLFGVPNAWGTRETLAWVTGSFTCGSPCPVFVYRCIALSVQARRSDGRVAFLGKQSHHSLLSQRIHSEGELTSQGVSSIFQGASVCIHTHYLEAFYFSVKIDSHCLLRPCFGWHGPWKLWRPALKVVASAG